MAKLNKSDGYTWLTAIAYQTFMHAYRFAVTQTRSDCTAAVFQILKLTVKANVDPLYHQISVFWRLHTPDAATGHNGLVVRNQDSQ